LSSNAHPSIKLNPTDCTQWIWRNKYALNAAEASIEDTWWRVANAAATAEQDPAQCSNVFHNLFHDFKFLPGGRILAGAGRDHPGTLCSCFVMGLIEDSFTGVQQALAEGAKTMQAGGGVGFDFSSLRPQGDPGYGGDAVAPGPIAVARILNAICQASITRSGRSGAMMATLRCDHPDIFRFIEAKQTQGALTHANLSVLVTDEFMQAVNTGAAWPLVFPHPDRVEGQSCIERTWTDGKVKTCAVYQTVDAKSLWQQIKQAAFDHGEPGVLFIDRINADSNLAGRELLLTTNPCAEQPLPDYGACTLGSLNLARFVSTPFAAGAQLDRTALSSCVANAVRFLDNIIDMARYPLPQQKTVALQSRRIGLGFTGLGDALAMLNLNYTSTAATIMAGHIMAEISNAAYQASAYLAAEKGSFPLFDQNLFETTPRAKRLPRETLELIRRHGLRNSHLTAIAPAGTISLLAGNVSSGIEPIFAATVERSVHTGNGQVIDIVADNYACHCWRTHHPDLPLPEQFVFAEEITPAQHINMLTAVQPFVDAGIAKTINLPANSTFAEAEQIFDQGYASGLKGCALFRPGARPSQLLCHS
jgi:ribonucleoside-diphosphate reductase alpha chain